MNKTPAFHFGQLIRQSREAAGISQRALAQKVGLDVSYINRLESGERRPRRATLLKLASALGIKGAGTGCLVYGLLTWRQCPC